MAMDDTRKLSAISPESDQTVSDDSLEEVSDKANISNEFSDLLPSFEMHNFMFNRTLTDDLPPAYQESITDTVGSSTQYSESVPFSEPALNPANFVLNNLHKLQKINLPFDVQVTLTEKLPQPGLPYESRNPLKQYFPGDMVYGFVIFENKSDTSLPFEMLLVSMECEIGVTHPKNKRQVKTKVLRMYDLVASYNFLYVDYQNTQCNMLDPSDNTRIGFRSRVMDPGTRVKKFFKFRIPQTMLDDNCEEQFPEHLKIVPSFGVNIYNLNTTAAAINIDPHLGYGRLDRTGSPIKVKDYALPGEFCSFFINIQIVGKRHDAYKKYYTKNTTHQYDFIFLKNAAHYFRVGKVAESPRSTSNYGSTADQLDLIEKTAQEAIEVLAERKMLKDIDITNIHHQDEIIFSSSGKIKASTDDLCNQSTEKLPLDLSYKQLMTFKFKKDLFSKLNGQLTVICKMDRAATLKSFLPKMLEVNPTSVLLNEEYMKVNSPVLDLELTYGPLVSGDKKLPTSLYITPTMIVIDVQSAFNIPFTIDGDFIRQSVDENKTRFKKFAMYYAKIGASMLELGTGIPKATNELLRGMAYVRYEEIRIPNVFKAVNIEVPPNSWVLESETGTYKFKTKVSLEYDVKCILMAPKTVIPSFQSCKISRLYKIHVGVTPKRAKTESTVFPITVI
ncbi:hypothetical protein PICMEDRAFT_14338 [Pichia membranifaciens NRRL Y-2026]|uniref:Bul1 N-terminal domain-containing protein n=1 Tax=Pichia membranifaciens NRRL Y-2026 TaxID=763406 RepID=A0A1E3NT12_9ASCO|nr:hypothetical protein PICMEDRAFT_14338 [Pichia membranifaciens NRRL Y-2026]ODQ48808.1 hypothetical protein PICMEDRAFT_14338 [Pichia membranifaciens NRRL Y-2026]